MTLSALGRLRALPTIALALALAAALAGCSTSEPAEEAPIPAPAGIRLRHTFNQTAKQSCKICVPVSLLDQ